VLALQNENIIVTGWVNDMKEYYAMSRIFMAPMRLGTGLQNKLLEAMAMHLPCVTSVLASAPLNSGEKKNMLICNSPLDYADSIDKLLLQPDFYQEIATNGYQFVRQNYKWEDTTSILENLITNNESDKT
jgi:glycosyltransferase involved in cell wall biosynthesis